VHPTQINQPSPSELEIIWQDGSASRISTRELRAGCPCSECTSAAARASLRYIPLVTDAATTIRAINLPNSSSLHIAWEDGHAGFYRFDYLRRIAPPRFGDQA
jgi:DUF971 family protein